MQETLRFQLVEGGRDRDLDAFARDVKTGLTSSPKRLPCRYFYDREGSYLFEAICRQPEYYLPRAERESLVRGAAEMVSGCAPGTVLIELGSGSATKTRVLIEALLARQKSLRYIPIDISRAILEESCHELLRDFPALDVTAMACEYQEGLARLNGAAGAPKLILWLGSNIGNLERVEATRFLRQIGGLMSPADHLLVTIDLRKERAVLDSAYDDSQGFTARFNLNLLVRINRELGGRFDIRTFRHRAFYNEGPGRIEMYLVSSRPQCVPIDDLGIEVSFAEGEAIHTEDSYKYSLAEIDALAGAAGLRVERQWFDGGRRLSVNLLAHAPSPTGSSPMREEGRGERGE
ncbi:MAG TPA: L-histidine N(alpha)-methyltransferase [Candidatus Methylomirabilis sp.]|nr:L-histidine N(alpha)-methyltransferase [Candidatus Methylomirabilis sp.]